MDVFSVDLFRFLIDLPFVFRNEPRKGINLFMIDLNGEALEAATTEFESKYTNVKILTKQLDLTKLSDEAIYNELDEELS